jgi:DegV family protein with EDD domain
VVVDSSTCLPVEGSAQSGITVVPMYLIVNGKSYRDSVDITPTDFYRILRRSPDEKLTTSAPSTADYVQAFLDAPGGVLCLTVAERLSGMHQSALLAADMIKNERQVVVLDSGTAAPGLGLLAEAAAAGARQGKGLEELTFMVRELAARVRTFGALETISYLARGGRIPQVASWGGKVLRVRPVIQLEGGRGSLKQLARTAGGARRSLQRVSTRAAEQMGVDADGAWLHLRVFHADALEEARQLAAELQETYPRAEVGLTEFTPAMGVHTGPGVVGTAFYVEPDTAERSAAAA